MTRFNPFSPVDCRYGAPMGRCYDAPSNFVNAPKLYATFQGGGGREFDGLDLDDGVYPDRDAMLELVARDETWLARGWRRVYDHVKGL